MRKITLLLLMFLVGMMHASGRRLLNAQKQLLAELDEEIRDTALFAPAMKAWMEWVSTEEELTLSDDHVDPLLRTQWNQNAPYNDSCPILESGSHAATGCVATAMAQVMYYWQYPLSAYSWEDMLLNYTNRAGQQATPAQLAAVAKLMSDCGKAINMDYGTSSSANSYDIGPVLVDSFGYNPGARFIYRKYKTYAEWAEMMRRELRAGRPILYRGASSSSGHCFVVDGFREDGLFHVNWGWGGVSDGWFRFTALTPAAQGTGGSTSEDGYNYNQAMYVDLAPASVLTTISTRLIQADSIGWYTNQSGKDSLRLYAYHNMSVSDTIAGYIALGIYHADSLLCKINRFAFTRLPSGTSWNRSINNLKLPQLQPNEHYKMLVLWQDTLEGTDWQVMTGIHHAPLGFDIYTNQVGTISHTYLPFGGHPVLDSIAITPLVPGQICQTMQVWTIDSCEWQGRVVLALDNQVDFQIITTVAVDLRSGYADTIRMISNTIDVPAGQYHLWAGYYYGNSLKWLPLPKSVRVETRPTTNRIYPLDNQHLQDTLFTVDNPILKADIRLLISGIEVPNTIYTGMIGAGVYDVNYPNPKTRYLSFTSVPVVCQMGDTIQVHFSADVFNQLPNGRYCMMIREMDNSANSYTVMTNAKYRWYFTVADEETDLRSVSTVDVPQTEKMLHNGHIYILKNGCRYDVLGRRY